MSKKIKVKHNIGDYVFTPKGAGIVKGFNITCNESTFILEYEIERTRDFSIEKYSKDPKIIWMTEEETFNSIKGLKRYLCYTYLGNNDVLENCLKENFKDVYGYKCLGAISL